MDIKCRKTSCKYNNAYTCKAKDVNISGYAKCETFNADESKPAEDFSKNIFEADTEDYANSRHIREVNLNCDAMHCLFNKEGKCNANGITVIDEGHGKTACATFIEGK